MPLRLGLVGIGHVADAQIAAINAVDGITLTAAHDVDSEKAHKLRNSPIEFFHGLNELIHNDDVDIIIVSVPNISHCEVAKRVIEQGRACVVEKPVSESKTEFDELIRLARSKHAYLAVALHASHALEVMWWNENASNFALGSVTDFECGFFDPYIDDGHLKPHAHGLGGAWFDSGINALSVVGCFVPPSHIRLEESRMTTLPQVPCQQVQGNAIFSFGLSNNGRGWGLIDTNWALGINRKVTRLKYGESGHEVILNHSTQTITIKRTDQLVFERAFGADLPRLTNHYIGVFTDLRDRYAAGESNLEYATEVHNLFFAAAGG